MLPTRLFRNVGIPPALRSLVTPHPSLPPTISVQLRLRLGISNPYSTKAPSTTAQSPKSSTSSTPATTTSQPPPDPVEPRLAMSFTCDVSGCRERSTHEFSKHAYERGIVIVQCPKCKNRHLIADHLGWFKETVGDDKFKTVEDILRARGETVRRGRISPSGVVEYLE